MVTQAQGRTAWLGICPWSIPGKGYLSAWGDHAQGSHISLEGQGVGLTCLDVLAPAGQPGRITQSLVSSGYRKHSGGLDASRVGRDRLLGPEGRGVCKMKA